MINGSEMSENVHWEKAKRSLDRTERVSLVRVHP